MYLLHQLFVEIPLSFDDYPFHLPYICVTVPTSVVGVNQRKPKVEAVEKSSPDDLVTNAVSAIRERKGVTIAKKYLPAHLYQFEMNLYLQPEMFISLAIFC